LAIRKKKLFQNARVEAVSVGIRRRHAVLFAAGSNTPPFRAVRIGDTNEK
jgi:hypothetical protein